MTQMTEVYHPDKVEVNWAGQFAITGFADGTMIETSRNNPRTSTVVGGKGDVGITKTADRTGTLTIYLLQNSLSNRYLSAIVNSEDLAGTLTRADITILDPSGGQLCYARRCHIQEPAPITLGDDQNAKVWTFFVEDLMYQEVPEGVFGEVAGVAGAVAGIGTVSDNLGGVLS